MKKIIYKIDKMRRYNFIIGTWERPDYDLKNRIRAQIGEAMEALGRTSESYSVSIIQSEGETGEEGLIILEGGSNYLIFFLLDSRSGETSSDLELEEEKEEIAQGIATLLPDNSRAALVLLYNCTIEMIEGKVSSPGVFV